MLLSKSCIYGIRATLYVASQKDRKFIPIKEISERLEISFHFLTKILQTLTQNDIMKSYRGPNGGVSLAKPADNITLLEIIHVLDNENFLKDCIIGLPGCGEMKPCPFHDDWIIEKKRIEDTFFNIKLSDLTSKIINSGLRLSPTGNCKHK